jgi:hypothetical protein
MTRTFGHGDGCYRLADDQLWGVTCHRKGSARTLVSGDYDSQYLDLAEPGVCGRAGPLMAAEPGNGYLLLHGSAPAQPGRHQRTPRFAGQDPSARA